MREVGVGLSPWGRGRWGWAAARGCAGRWPGCGACPRLGFAARGRCGPSPGVLRGRIYFRPGWGVGGGLSPAPAGRVSWSLLSARPVVAARPPAHGVCSSRGGGGASDGGELPGSFGRSVRRKTSRPSRQSAATANTRVCTSRMQCALTVILLPESREHGCHMLKTWFPDLGVPVELGRRRRRRGWLACAARSGETSTNAVCP